MTSDHTTEELRARERYDLIDAQVQVEVIDRIDAGHPLTPGDARRADELITSRDVALRAWLDEVALRAWLDEVRRP